MPGCVRIKGIALGNKITENHFLEKKTHFWKKNNMENLNDNEAPAGRGLGIDWVAERTFETGTSSNKFEICNLL